jgi:predicted lipase
VVLAFRGTASKENWKHNWESIRKNTDYCPKCRVHGGFWDQWTPIRERLVKKVREAHDKFPDFRLIITGHSLGGAIATLAAADIRKIDVDPWYLTNTELFTFGSPRVGNKHTARFLSKQSTLSYRVTSLNDPIPNLPFHAFGYWHTQPEYWIMRNPDAPERNDIMVVTGYNNRLGNRGHKSLNKKIHRVYFGRIASCGDERH